MVSKSISTEQNQAMADEEIEEANRLYKEFHRKSNAFTAFLKTCPNVVGRIAINKLRKSNGLFGNLFYVIVDGIRQNDCLLSVINLDNERKAIGSNYLIDPEHLEIVQDIL